jgi:hypothetical protein
MHFLDGFFHFHKAVTEVSEVMLDILIDDADGLKKWSKEKQAKSSVKALQYLVAILEFGMLKSWRENDALIVNLADEARILFEAGDDVIKGKVFVTFNNFNQSPLIYTFTTGIRITDWSKRKEIFNAATHISKRLSQLRLALYGTLSLEDIAVQLLNFVKQRKKPEMMYAMYNLCEWMRKNPLDDKQLAKLKRFINRDKLEETNIQHDAADVFKAWIQLTPHNYGELQSIIAAHIFPQKIQTYKDDPVFTRNVPPSDIRTRRFRKNIPNSIQ